MQIRPATLIRMLTVYFIFGHTVANWLSSNDGVDACFRATAGGRPSMKESAGGESKETTPYLSHLIFQFLPPVRHFIGFRLLPAVLLLQHLLEALRLRVQQTSASGAVFSAYQASSEKSTERGQFALSVSVRARAAW